MQVVILAGGLATRLGPLSQDTPKSMVQVLGIPFLEYQLDFLKKGGIEDIVLCVGHLGEQIADYFKDGSRFGVSIRYSREDKLLGTAGAIKNASGLLEGVFFTLYGDSYLFLDFGDAMSFFESKNKLALMSVYKNYGKYSRSNTATEGELVSKYSKHEKTADMVYIEYGINIFKKEILDMIPAGHYSLEKLVPQLIDKRELLAYEVTERFYDIGTPRGLREFREFARESPVTRHLLAVSNKQKEVG